MLKKDNKVDLPLSPINDSSHLNSKKILSTLNPSFQIISVGSIKVMPLPATAFILASFLISPIIIYSILTLLLIAIIWLVVRKKLWNL